jgi:hypothetical protein
MKSIAARYDGRPPSASDSRAPDADCSGSSVSILTASVGLGTSRDLLMQQLYLELRLHVDPVVVLRGPGDRRRAVRCAAGDLVNFQLAGESVVRSDHRHAKVEQVGDDGEQRRLLAAVLRRRRRKGPA